MENVRVKKKFKFQLPMTNIEGVEILTTGQIECYPDEFRKALWGLYELEMKDIKDLQEIDIPTRTLIGTSEFLRLFTHNDISTTIDISILDGREYKGWKIYVSPENSVTLVPPSYFVDQMEIQVETIFQLSQIFNLIRMFDELTNC